METSLVKPNIRFILIFAATVGFVPLVSPGPIAQMPKRMAVKAARILDVKNGVVLIENGRPSQVCEGRTDG